MKFEHKELANGRWMELPFVEQMANIGSEIERTIKWRNKGNENYKQHAFDRVLELLYLTIDDKKNVSRLRELTRVREALLDYFQFNNEYNSTDLCWQKYFYNSLMQHVLKSGMIQKLQGCDINGFGELVN